VLSIPYSTSHVGSSILSNAACAGYQCMSNIVDLCVGELITKSKITHWPRSVIFVADQKLVDD